MKNEIKVIEENLCELESFVAKLCNIIEGKNEIQIRATIKDDKVEISEFISAKDLILSRVVSIEGNVKKESSILSDTTQGCMFNCKFKEEQLEKIKCGVRNIERNSIYLKPRHWESYEEDESIKTIIDTNGIVIKNGKLFFREENSDKVMEFTHNDLKKLNRFFMAT